MSDASIIVTTNLVVSKAMSSGLKSSILGDVTNLGSPKKPSATVKSGTGNLLGASSPASSSPLLRSVPNEDIFGNSATDVMSSDSESEEELDHWDSFGIDMEEKLAKPANKKLSKAAFSKVRNANNNNRYGHYVKAQVAVAQTKKATEKARSVELKKAIASKQAKQESHPEIRRAESPTPAVSVLLVQRSEKVTVSIVIKTVETVNFDDCVVETPALPSLSPIPVSENQFEVLNLVEEEQILVDTPRCDGLVTRVINTVKRVVKKVKRAIVKLAKKALKAAKNMVSM